MSVHVVSGASGVGANSSASVSWSHTVPNGTDRLLIVGLSHRSSGTITITFDGIALAPVPPYMNDGNQKLFYLLNPPVKTANVVANLTGSNVQIAANAVNLAGVDQATPFGVSALLGSGVLSPPFPKTRSQSMAVVPAGNLAFWSWKFLTPTANLLDVDVIGAGETQIFEQFDPNFTLNHLCSYHASNGVDACQTIGRVNYATAGCITTLQGVEIRASATDITDIFDTGFFQE